MRRENFYWIPALSALIFLLLLGGCGSSKKEGTTAPTASATRIDNSNCTDTCHAATLSSVTGKSIVFEWMSSSHKKGAELVDCQSCHGGGSLHWGLGPIPHPNPDNDGVCSANTCHPNLGFPHKPILTPAILASPVIWDNMSTAGYVTSQNTNKCRTCHNPHNNTVLQQNFDWANSAHAAKKDAPWIHYDFKARDNCNRCHTTTGYIKYLTTGDTKAWAVANSSDKTKEVLRCDGCHQDYSWKRRTALTAVGGVNVPYGTFDSVIPPPGALFPYGKLSNSATSTVVRDVGDTNVCINCHTGTNSGRGIDTAPNSVLTGTFAPLNSHYFGAAGDLYALNGYEYQVHESYLTTAFAHYRIGVDAVVGLGTSRGPCVGCHMDNTNNSSHRFLPIELQENGTGPRGIINGTITAFPAFAGVCAKCHGPTGLNLFDDISSLAVGGGGIQDLKIEYRDRLAELETLLRTKFGIFYNPDAYPYFFTSTGAQFKAWPNKGVLGAAFNLNNLTREPGGYAHNHSYTALLIYDSLDFLTNGAITGTYTSPAFPSGRVP